MSMTEMLCGILHMEYDSPEAAEKSVRKYWKCPCVTFWATKGSDAYIILVVPEAERYWAEYVAEHPRQTFGGGKAELVFADKVYRPELEMNIPDELGDVSPCGSNCATCPGYSTCTGCPATVHYKHLDNKRRGSI